MAKTVKSVPGTRSAMFWLKQIKCYLLSKNRDIHLWIRVWREAEKLNKELRNEVEYSIIKSMLELGFTFQDGHELFNSGLCRGLGRRAMWLGFGLAANSLEIKREEIVSCENILGKMLESLGTPSDEEKVVVVLMNGRLKRKIKPIA